MVRSRLRGRAFTWRRDSQIRKIYTLNNECYIPHLPQLCWSPFREVLTNIKESWPFSGPKPSTVERFLRGGFSWHKTLFVISWAGSEVPEKGCSTWTKSERSSIHPKTAEQAWASPSWKGWTTCAPTSRTETSRWCLLQTQWAGYFEFVNNSKRRDTTWELKIYVYYHCY